MSILNRGGFDIGEALNMLMTRQVSSAGLLSELEATQLRRLIAEENAKIQIIKLGVKEFELWLREERQKELSG